MVSQVPKFVLKEKIELHEFEGEEARKEIRRPLVLIPFIVNTQSLAFLDSLSSSGYYLHNKSFMDLDLTTHCSNEFGFG